MRWLIQTVTSLKECAGGIEITPPEAANSVLLLCYERRCSISALLAKDFHLLGNGSRKL